MQTLDKFNSVSNAELSKISGGYNADYNLSSEWGRTARKFTDGIVRWQDCN
ncbi:hypothetical protein [Lactobacillus kalixensis]|uniref:Uncharacterized protein n=1 Tax=Lactobacillus kalixensis DSM 16043 TaxID=1423763 RepID=A0A0R1U6H0_9LACO|nr:hypothetical protein [Lactobacillus kalixensis]KRL88815.1 hypothetical protein FC46_GL001257 [Lactobacillus kalixensis DSM 16043]